MPRAAGSRMCASIPTTRRSSCSTRRRLVGLTQMHNHARAPQKVAGAAIRMGSHHRPRMATKVEARDSFQPP